MGFFDQFHKNGAGAIKPQHVAVRKEIVRSTPTPTPSNAHRALQHGKRAAGASVKDKTRSTNGVGSRPSSASPAPIPVDKKPQNVRKRRLVATQRLVSSDDDSDGDSLPELSTKRPKTNGTAEERDPKRKVRSKLAFSTDSDGTFPLVHAAQIASLKPPTKFVAAFDGQPEAGAILGLQYPSNSRRERYELVKPRESDDFRPLQDILLVAELVSRHYLTEEQANPIMDEGSGIHRKLKRAIARQSEQEFREGVEEYNESIGALRDRGAIQENLDKMHSLSLPLVEHVLTQIYARTVSLKVDSLRKYENGTDNVYGELLPRFVSKIFEDTRLQSDQIFVDLGSGVANVVLQAALQIGCESWGCEMMDNACDLAELQEKEFAARCRLWGLETGTVRLERGDFLKNAAIGKVLQRADVVLVNNQAFTPALNNGLINLFLDLKEGCQIVSLKSFVPTDHKITTRNFNSPVNVLEVETKPYYSNCVSWTNAPGTYCIARKDSRKLQAFAERVM